MSNKKNILVIGASGSLGSGICSELRNKYSIYGTYCNNKIEKENITYLKLDITKKESFNSIKEKFFDTVVLIAGAMPATMEGYDPERYIDVNIYGTLNVLEFCRKNNVKKIIYIMTFSDRYEYFYSGIPIPADGKVSLNYTGDHSIYSISKVTACELIEHYHQQYELQTIIFRIPTVYCYDDKINYYVDGELCTKAYIKMIKNVIHDKKIEIWGNKENSKDMPYIKDFAELISLAIENNNAQGIYNAGTSDPISLEDFANAIIKVFGNNNHIEKIYKETEISQPNFTFDMKKTFETFSYKPKYKIEDILEDIKKNIKKDLLY